MIRLRCMSFITGYIGSISNQFNRHGFSMAGSILENREGVVHCWPEFAWCENAITIKLRLYSTGKCLWLSGQKQQVLCRIVLKDYNK